MKQKLVIIYRHTVLQETEKLDQSLIDQHLGMLCFYGNTRRSNFLWTQHFDWRLVCEPIV